MSRESRQRTFPSMREAFEAHYRPTQVPAANRKGFKISYVYIGPWYIWEQETQEVRRVRQRCLNACLLSLILYVAAALQAYPVNYDRLVSLTGLASLAPFCFVVFGVIQFYAAKDRMREETYKDINGKLRIAPVLHAVLLAACAVRGTYMILASGVEKVQLWIVLCYLLAAAESLSIYFRYRKLKCKKEENREAPPQ